MTLDDITAWRSVVHPHFLEVSRVVVCHEDMCALLSLSAENVINRFKKTPFTFQGEQRCILMFTCTYFYQLHIAAGSLYFITSMSTRVLLASRWSLINSSAFGFILGKTGLIDVEFLDGFPSNYDPTSSTNTGLGTCAD